MLNLAGHDCLFNSLILEESNHATELANTDPRHTLSQLFNSRICFLMDGCYSHGSACLPRSLKDHKRKPAVTCNKPEFHLVTPRVEASMKVSRSVTSVESLISSLIRSMA